MKLGWNLFVLLALPVSVAMAEAESEYDLRAGYPVAVAIMQHVHSTYDEPNDPVLMRVTYEVMADGVVVIPEGFTFYGHIGSKERAKNRGRAGRITVATRRIEGVNGRPLGVRGLADSEGTDKGAQQAQLFGVWGLLGKGSAAFILKGTPLEATTLNDQKLGELSEPPSIPAANGRFSATVSPKTYKISFSKSKKNIPEVVVNHSGASNVRIVKINDVYLPKPVRPISNSADKAIFGGWDVVKYLDDGDNKIVMQAGSDDNIVQAEAFMGLKIK